MCVKGQRGQVFRSGDRTRQGKNGKRESSRSNGLANAEKCKRYAKVFGIGKLLQIICQRFCKSSKTPL